MSFSAEEHEEKQRQHLKYFDYAELPVKRWIADYLGHPASALFDRCEQTETDGIIFENNGKYWKVYLEHRPGDNMAFDIKPWLNNEKFNNAMKMIMDAFQLVYMPVIMTITYPDPALKTYIELVAPKFNPQLMRVELMPVSYEEMKFLGLKNRLLQINQTNDQIAKVMEKKLDLKNPEVLRNFNLMKEEQGKIAAEKSRLEADIAAVDHEKIKEQRAKLPEISAKLLNHKKLYIVLEEYRHDMNNQLVQKRLPVFGHQYADPDDETWREKLEEL